MSVFLLAVLGVLGRVQQGVQLRRAARLHLDHPPILVRARVDLPAIQIHCNKHPTANQNHYTNMEEFCIVGGGQALLVYCVTYQAGSPGELFVDLDDLAGDGRVHVAGGLHALHVAERSALGHLRAGLRQLHEHHLPEMSLRPAKFDQQFLFPDLDNM